MKRLFIVLGILLIPVAMWVQAGPIISGGGGGGGSGTGADVSGYYLVGRGTNAPTNAINLGILPSGILEITVSTGSASVGVASYDDIVGLWTTCSGYLKSDGTCDTPTGAGTVTGSGTNHYWTYWTGASSISGKTITASKPVCSDANGDPVVCAGTEGIWQITGSYQTADADLTYLAGFTPSANVKTILNAADNAAVQTALGYITLSGSMTDEQLLCGETTGGTNQAKSCGAKVTDNSTASHFIYKGADSILVDAQVTGTGSTLVLASAPTLVTPYIGAATGISLIVTGIVDGLTKVVTSAATNNPVESPEYLNILTLNIITGTGSAVQYTLPVAATGKTRCYRNYTGKNGTITIVCSGIGQYMDVDGVLTASGGSVISSGSSADSMCAVGVDATHWLMYTQKGTWTHN